MSRGSGCARSSSRCTGELVPAPRAPRRGAASRVTRNLTTGCEDAPAPQSSDPETERYLLFNAVTRLLGEVAGIGARCAWCSMICTGPMRSRWGC